MRASQGCEDEEDAKRMAETILRKLGFPNVQAGASSVDVNDRVSPAALRDIARAAERIARWARKEAMRGNAACT